MIQIGSIIWFSYAFCWNFEWFWTNFISLRQKKLKTTKYQKKFEQYYWTKKYYKNIIILVLVEYLAKVERVGIKSSR